MNRDREAQTWLATRVASARRTIAGWSPEVRAAVGLALPVGDGVEEALRDALECIVGLHYMPAKMWDERWPKWAGRWAAMAGQEDRADLLSCEIAEAALSPTTLGGGS